jgi:enoyl-CoA hydratase/carnithine racemase
MPMIRQLRTVYNEWVVKPTAVKVILMEGAGDKAFCAGGDVAAVQRECIAGGTLPADFFFEEYELNNIIATMFDRRGVVQIAIWDGITMGGGVGLSVHGKFRVATEHTVFAKPGTQCVILRAVRCMPRAMMNGNMPETAIGLFPDVGGTHVLSRVCGGLPVGLYIGLTGVRLGAADCLATGLATHYIPRCSGPRTLACYPTLTPC